MKTVLAVLLSVLFLSGCVYTRPIPYRSNYTVVTPVPRYERHLYTPRPLPPPPRFEFYQERPHFQTPSHRHRHQPRSRRYW